MSVAEFKSWVRFYEEEPFGDVRADLRSGIVASLIARTMGGRKGAKPMDFMPIVSAQRNADAVIVTDAQRSAIMRQTFEGNLGPVRVKRAKIRKG